MSKIKINKFIINAWLYSLLLTSLSSFGNDYDQRKPNRITVLGRVDMNYVIPKQNVLIPIKDKCWSYTSLDLDNVNRDKVQIHTEPAANIRLAFKEKPEKDHWLGPINWFGRAILSKDGQFEIDIDVDDKVSTVFMVLRGGIHSEKFGHEGYRVIGFHELDLEEDKRTYEVDIAFQALLPSEFSGRVQNIAGREEINATVRHIAEFNGQVFSMGTSKCADDGSFKLSILPLDGAVVKFEVRGLNHVEFETKSMLTDYIPLRKIKEEGLLIEVQERPVPSVIFLVEIVDKDGHEVVFGNQYERAVFYIGLDEHKQQDIDYNWQDLNIRQLLFERGIYWVSAGVERVNVWDVSPGKKSLFAGHSDIIRKIIPQTIEIKDLAEEDRPQLINVKIVHEP